MKPFLVTFKNRPPEIYKADNGEDVRLALKKGHHGDLPHWSSKVIPIPESEIVSIEEVSPEDLQDPSN